MLGGERQTSGCQGGGVLKELVGELLAGGREEQADGCQEEEMTWD